MRAACLAIALFASAAQAATPMVSAGESHTLALRADGTVRAWGSDEQGQAGSGRRLISTNPIAVPGFANARWIHASDRYNLVVKADGTVWGWGHNGYVPLGEGTSSNRSTPVQVPGLSNVTRVSGATYFAAALRSDGTVWMWGNNGCGELGDGTNTNRVEPAPTLPFGTATALSVSASHTLALRSDGTVWAWGCNNFGQLGDGTTNNRSVPARIAALSDIVAISAGDRYSLVVRADGTVWAWGSNDSGELGDGTMTQRNLPVQVSGIGNVRAVSATGPTIALKNDGTVWAWGYGPLGNGSSYGSTTPVQVTGLADVAEISTGQPHATVRKSDGTVWGWGWNTYGELGDGTTTFRDTPVQVTGFSGATAISAGYKNSLALNAGGLWVWGDNEAGELADGAILDRTTPIVVAGLDNVIAVAAGFSHSVALKGDGSVWAWGSNVYGPLGDNGLDRSTPTRVPNVSNAAEISAGGGHTLARLADGTVLTFGYGGGPDAAVVPGLSGVTGISAGWAHSLAVRSDGTVWAWGSNDSGQLGDGTTTDRATPVQVTGLINIRAVSAGQTHSLALGGDGIVYAWGGNNLGQLGDGTRISRLTPVAALGLTGARAIAAGYGHSLAIDAQNRAWAWGNSGPYVDSDVPAPVAGLADVAAIAGGKNQYYGHSVAATADGATWTWGFNDNGQLGDGTLAARDLPVVVLREDGAGSVAGNDWFLDLDPARPTAIPADKVPVFLVVASNATGSLVANLKYRAQDVGTVASTFVFAYAPASLVRGATAKAAGSFGVTARGSPKDAPVSCALAQLNTQGQLVAVSAASLQAYVSGVLSAQGQAVAVLNGASAAALAGATFFVGYGANGQAMLVNGTNRSVVSVPANVACSPQAPQAGWWYNPAEGGRGFSIEARGNRLFMAAFHYDTSGRATWNFAGGATSLDGSLFTADFLGASGGQTLTGTYKLPGLTTVGPITFAFSDSTHGTMIWPGGTVAIERQPFVQQGLTAPAQAGLPESGWWWNPAESGRGFFIEWQNGYADVAGYMYDAAGNPTWYITVAETPNPLRIAGNWWTFAGGQSMGGPYKPATRTSDNAGALAIEFASATTATMTLPDGRRIPLVRQAF